jgi:hypothetical protein
VRCCCLYSCEDEALTSCPWRGDEADDGADIDDCGDTSVTVSCLWWYRSRRTQPCPFLDHALRDCLRDIEQPKHIGLECVADLFHVDLDERPYAALSSIVDKDVCIEQEDE